MKAFQFPLQRVLDWRTIQLRAEEEKLSALLNKLAEIVHRDNALVAAQLNAELQLLQQPAAEGSEFRALAAFQLHIRNERASLVTLRADYENKVAAQRQRLLKARKDCKVLENLKDRRRTTWTYLNDRELENTAAESYISNWLRSNAEQ